MDMLRGGALTGFLLAILVIASEAFYLALLRLNVVNGARPVTIFLAVLGAEFALCFVAYYVMRNKSAKSCFLPVCRPSCLCAKNSPPCWPTGKVKP
ncbi:MAG: hypothetical protein DMG58_33090 [Acidobacteria bacterium]|nr:MAG: hypothetical protein DMG58_33090 [Acidobacteriota bacterium]